MPKKTLAEIDEDIAGLITTISYYNMLMLAATSLGDLPLPSTYEHHLVSLLATTSHASKDLDKVTRKYLEAIVNGTKSRKSAAEIAKHMVAKTTGLVQKFDKLVATRIQMATVITQKKMQAIASASKSVPKSEKKELVKKLAKMHNLSSFI
jgi:hypothetical protein